MQALGNNRKAMVLVGAQAIYLWIGESDLAVAPCTTDADLAIDPSRLEDNPDLPKALRNAGFELTIKPGTWTMKANKVQVDFLVPSSLSGPGRRGARLGIHGDELARKSKGLEATIVDNSLLRVSSLEDSDSRSFEVRVAGLPALLVAKLHKIAERKSDSNRLQDKDTLDVLRILRATETKFLAMELQKLTAHSISADVTKEACSFLQELFSNRKAIGPQMAARGTSPSRMQTPLFSTMFF